MNDKLKEVFTTIGGTNGNMVEEMEELFNIPNEKFDAVYGELKNSIVEVLDNPDTQKQLIKDLNQNPITNFESELETMKELLKLVDEDDTLSENKKDLLKTVINKSAKTISELSENLRERIPVKIVKIYEDSQIPKYANPTDAGADIYSYETVNLKPNETRVIKTGIKVAIPNGYEIQIRPRSGLSLKTPLRVANSVGTIDALFRQEIGVIMWNSSNTEEVKIEKGDRIAQMLIAPTPMIKFVEVEELDETNRGEGFGSTGRK